MAIRSMHQRHPGWWMCVEDFLFSTANSTFPATKCVRLTRSWMRFAEASNIKYFYLLSTCLRSTSATPLLLEAPSSHLESWSRCHSSTNESNPSSSWSDHFHLHDCARNWCAHSLTVNEDKINGFVFLRQDVLCGSFCSWLINIVVLILPLVVSIGQQQQWQQANDIREFANICRQLMDQQLIPTKGGKNWFQLCTRFTQSRAENASEFLNSHSNCHPSTSSSTLSLQRNAKIRRHLTFNTNSLGLLLILSASNVNITFHSITE